MYIKLIILTLLVSFCSSTPYIDEYQEKVIKAHQEFYGLVNSTDSADQASILIKVKNECKYISDEIKIHEKDNLNLEWVIDFHYITLRQTSKSHDEEAAIRNLDKTPQQVMDYMIILYKYCGFDEVFDKNWDNLQKREKSFLEYSN